MSWSSAGLPVICGREDVLWSVRGAALVLDCQPDQVATVIRRAGIAPAGKRHEAGLGTRHMRVYPAVLILRAWDSAVNNGLVKLF